MEVRPRIAIFLAKSPLQPPIINRAFMFARAGSPLAILLTLRGCTIRKIEVIKSRRAHDARLQAARAEFFQCSGCQARHQG